MRTSAVAGMTRNVIGTLRLQGLPSTWSGLLAAAGSRRDAMALA